MRILITGSAGFLGRNAVTHWEQQGHHVTGIDIRTNIDCRHIYQTNEHFDIVMHFAAIVGGRANIDGNPIAVAQTTALDVAFFDYVLRTRPDHAIYPSSSAAYPTYLQERGHSVPLAEHHIDLDNPAAPDAAYGWVKLYGEQLATRANNHGTNIHIIRPMSGYGTDQDTTYPFGAFLARTKAKADPFTIWGDGTQTRDWIHVHDIMNTIDTIITTNYQHPLNIGTGQPTTFTQLAHQFTTHAGYVPHLDYHPNNPTGVHTRVADVKNLHTIYTPQITLDQGIQAALAGAHH